MNVENTILNLDDEEISYIHSEEFISKFGDWEKANRLEKFRFAGSIEKEKLIDFVLQNKKVGNLSPLITQRETDLEGNEMPYLYYDKRLINIFQVPQMPYLEKVNGKWLPTKETVNAVKTGKLYIQKNGQDVIIFKDGKNISIGTHNKNIKDFVKQIKTADQIIYTDSEISRVASLILQNGGSRVRLHDAISNRVINSHYDKTNLLSTNNLQFSESKNNLKENIQFEYDGLTYIPIRALSENEKELINKRSPKNYGTGLKIGNEVYTSKIVFIENSKGEVFYDQSLSAVEKSQFLESIKKLPEVLNQINRLEYFGNSDGTPSTYYDDKRLINICQVPQMPYLEKVNGKWLPTLENFIYRKMDKNTE